jgi:hypothetical protein
MGAQDPVTEDRMTGVDLEHSISSEGLEGYQLRLDRFRKHPLDFNHARAEELAELGMLHALQIENWIRYRERFGPAPNWYVLQGVPGWDSLTVERIRPYIQFVAKSDWKNSFRRGAGDHHFFLWRWSFLSPTALPRNVAGNAAQLLLRYQYQSVGGIEAGLLLEKDPGESLRRPDFTSFHLLVQSPGRSTRWVLGDYTVQMGQGLIAWQGMSFASVSDVASVKKQGLFIRPYHSVGESRFMRGLAGSGSIRKWSWDGFISRHGQSAVLYEVNPVGQVFRQVDESGYHRTVAERSRKGAVMEYSVGGRIGIRLQRDRLNLNFIARNWNRPMMRLHIPLYGDTSFLQFLSNASMDYSITRGSWHGFGEFALDGWGHHALVLGSVLVLDHSVEASGHFRWVGRNFYSVDGEILQVQSGVRAEQGVRLQLRWRLDPWWTLDVYGDLFCIPNASFQSEVPAVGGSRGMRMQFQPNKKRLIYVRMQTMEREQNGSGRWLSTTRMVRQFSVRGHAQWDLDPRFQLAIRTERTLVGDGDSRPESGFLNYAEVHYEPIGSRLQADFRLMWVQTDGWDSRVYAYERNVLYQVGFPAFSGNLVRGYLNLAWKWDRHATLWFRWSVQKYTDNQHFNEYERKIEHSITLQFRLQLGGDGR